MAHLLKHSTYFVTDAQLEMQLISLSKEDEAEAYVVHKGEADEGRIDWQAPVVAVLINSNTVDTKGGHWNMDMGMCACAHAAMRACGHMGMRA